MTAHLHRRDLPSPPEPTADSQRALREALRLRLHFLDRDIADHERGIASAEADPSPLGRKELALRSQLLPGLCAERRCVARRLDAITPEPPPVPVVFVPPVLPPEPNPQTYLERQAEMRRSLRRRLAEMGATR